MKIKKSLAALTATVSIMALATGCSSSGSSGVVDTQADKGLAVMGDNAPVLFNVHNSEDALLRPHAARLDGASDWRIFHQVVLPMSRNSIAALAIFTFLWNWEDYLWPFLMIADDDKQLLSVGIKMFSGQYGTDYGGLFAATSVTIIPVVIVYLVFQKQFIAGIATGSGK